MTTLLRLMGASIMGILDPVPSSVPSPMTNDEAAWVRANAWTKGLRRIEDAYPRGFFRWCSCERGTCHPCAVRAPRGRPRARRRRPRRDRPPPTAA
ncbi:DUF6248 family natural product biosynthesis protein, partial [Streptomyces sp. NPDC001948]